MTPSKAIPPGCWSVGVLCFFGRLRFAWLLALLLVHFLYINRSCYISIALLTHESVFYASIFPLPLLFLCSIARRSSRRGSGAKPNNVGRPKCARNMYVRSRRDAKRPAARHLIAPQPKQQHPQHRSPHLALALATAPPRPRKTSSVSCLTRVRPAATQRSVGPCGAAKRFVVS